MGKSHFIGLLAAGTIALAACGGGGGVTPQGSGAGTTGGYSPSGSSPSPAAWQTPPAGTSSPSPAPSASPVWNPNSLPVLTDASAATSGVFLGADCGVSAAVSCANFASAFRHGIALGTIYASWDQDLSNVITQNGLTSWTAQRIVPDITWQPSSNFSTITLAGIASGTYDSYITKSAQALKSFGQPIFLRPMHEFNTQHYPWGLNQNGADAAADANYIAAWQHIVNIFRAQGAANVKFIWCFNSSTSPNQSWNQPASAYPGDAYVDWVAFDAYNMGSNSNGRAWWTFNYIVSGAYKTAVAVSPAKPVMITEIASNEYGDGGTMKAAWVDAMFSTLVASPNQYPHLHALSWYETDNANFTYDSKSTEPVYQRFALDMRSYNSQGVLNIRSNGQALWG
ncbi:MAG TPA: glycosyl hydrolase, partial [Candidatus Baltobacteraceae bacterium]|nr:glycosyl hydrolase [Candidatus Baltobacteraceae bacterium]